VTTGSPPATRSRRGRLVAFGVVVLAAVGVAVGYGVHAAGRDDAADRIASLPASSRLDPRTLAGTARIVFRSSGRDGAYGLVSMVRRSEPDGGRAATTLQCDRVDMVPGTGLCLAASPGIYTSYKLFTFGEDFTVRKGFPLTGIPSRARLSPDGRFASVTTFVSGHSYASGSFSTATTIYDLSRGASLGNVESFSVVRDGKTINPPDRNLWGVTFATGDDRFYATFATKGTYYLVEGSLRARRLTTIATGVECPALSPDGTRVAFKHRSTSGPVRWRLTVLDLKTKRTTALAETRSVDDQPAWYDDDTVAYGLPRQGDSVITDVWSTPSDGSGHPSVLVQRAWSPAFVRA
jgi:hypothetical protein